MHDLLVVYTPAAKAALRPGHAREHDPERRSAAANQAYQNSAVGITLNLVGLKADRIYRNRRDPDVAHTTCSTTGDGKLEEVQTLRDSVGARTSCR